MKTIGIDPGTKSGFAALSDHHVVEARVIKVTSARDCVEALRPHADADVVYIEGQWIGKVDTGKGRGRAQSALKTGRVAGWWEAAAQMLNIRVEFVAPGTWRSPLKIPQRPRELAKQVAVERATERWGIVQTDAAEAAWIGLYGHLTELRASK